MYTFCRTTSCRKSVWHVGWQKGPGLWSNTPRPKVWRQGLSRDWRSTRYLTDPQYTVAWILPARRQVWFWKKGWPHRGNQVGYLLSARLPVWSEGVSRSKEVYRVWKSDIDFWLSCFLGRKPELIISPFWASFSSRRTNFCQWQEFRGPKNRVWGR